MQDLLPCQRQAHPAQKWKGHSGTSAVTVEGTSLGTTKLVKGREYPAKAGDSDGEAPAGRSVSLEHPWNSFIWDTPEALELTEDDRVFVACYSSCCYGGWRTKWTCLITNDESLFRAVDRPHCPGHWWVQPYQVHETPF